MFSTVERALKQHGADAMTDYTLGGPMENWEILFGRDRDTTTHSDHPNDAVRAFRSMIGTKRDAEEQLAAAVEARQRALAEVDEVVRHAEVLAREIEAQARARAEQVVAEATAAAERVTAEAEARAALADAELGRAQRDAELVREQARAEATAQRAEYLAEVDAQASRTILRLETLADDLDLALERAKDDLVETMIPLAELRHQVQVDPADLSDESDTTPDGPHSERRRNPFRSKE